MKKPKMPVVVFRKKVLEIIAIAISVVGLFGYVLARKDLHISFTLHVVGAVTSIGYCFIKHEDEEWNPITKAWKDMEDERENINNQYINDCEQFERDKAELRLQQEKEINELREQHNLDIEQNKKDALDEYQKLSDLFNDEINFYVEQLELKDNWIKKSQLPKLAKGIGRCEYYANKIIEILYGNNIEADYAESWEEYGFDLIRLLPKKGKIQDYKNLAQDLQLELRLNKPPRFEIKLGFIEVKVDTTFVTTEYASDKKILKLEIVTGDWLTPIAERIIHCKVDGQTRSGKSNFVCNFVNILTDVHADGEFVKVDPKYPMSLANLKPEHISIHERKPKYPHINNALNGLKQLGTEITTRLELASEDVANGKEIRTFTKKVFIIDEIDWIITAHGKEGTDNLLIGLKVAAALNIIVIYFGQTPRCSKLKMTKDDFRNSTNISLGSNIPDAIDAFISDESYKNQLNELYWREIEKGNQYICLVAEMGKKPFLAALPGCGAYLPAKNPESLQNESSGFSEVTDSEILALILDIQEDFTDSQIVERLWNIKPSRSDGYLNRVARVRELREQTES